MEQINPKAVPLSPETLLLLVSADYNLTAPVSCARKSSGLNDVFTLTAADEPADRDFLRTLTARLHERLETRPPGTLGHGYCHGDFRPANLHLDETTGVVTPFDFETGGLGFRAYDIAYTQTNLHHLARELLWR